MIKNVIFCIAIMLLCKVYGQEELITFEHTLKDEIHSVKEVYPIVNSENGDVSLFLIDAKNVSGYLLDNSFKIINELKSEDRRKKYKTILGYNIGANDNYNLFFTNKNKNKFGILNLSYSDKKSSVKEFSLQDEGERFLQSINVNNNFYLISIFQYTSILKLYSFDDNGEINTGILDYKKMGRKVGFHNLYSYLIASGISTRIKEVKKIDNNVPISIELASERTKMYVQDSKVTITFDKNLKTTYVLSFDVNLKDEGFKQSLKKIKKPFYDITKNRKRSNSFINEDKIYSIAATSKDLKFYIYNLNSEELLKEYGFNYNDDIPFKNSPIIQEGGMYDGYRELKKTSQLLRKITSGEIGIAVNKYEDGYNLTLGGKKVIKQGGMMMPGFGGIPIGSIGAVSFYFNPSYLAYNSYTNTRSTFVNCLFDNHFNHIKGEVKENIFDKIKDFEEYDKTYEEVDEDDENNYELSISSDIETIFKLNGNYLRCVYFPYSNRIRLRKF